MNSSTTSKVLSTKTAVPSVAPSVQEFSIRVPKNSKKKHNVMRFNATLNVDFTKWVQVKMERENNMKEYKGMEEEMPKFGAGSEFGRDAKEEARRKKYGIVCRKYKPEAQPWILKSGGKTGKKFKGIREGGISENASYYVFTHAADGAIEAFPLHEWYNFQPIQRYKALSAEEAEQEFSRRNKVMNYFSLMLRKRLKNDDDGADDEELIEGGKSKRPGKKEKELKISDMDEWMDSDNDKSNSNDDEPKGSEDEEDTKKKKKVQSEKRKKKKNEDEEDEDEDEKNKSNEAFEDSDDGDNEGKECDYISDSSASESELDEQQKEIKSVAEEDALRKLLVSDEEDDNEKQTDKEDDEDKDEDDEGKEKDAKDKYKLFKEADKKKDKKKKKKAKKKDQKKSVSGKDSSSDFSSDSDSDSDTALKDKDNKKSNSAHSSRSATPTPAADSLKRKQSGSPDLSQAKKLKLDNFNLVQVMSYIPGASESGITEDAVRRYLMRKPMTTIELLQKFKSKKTGLTSEQLVNIMTQILKKINPTKQTIKNKMYLSIKAQTN